MEPTDNAKLEEIQEREINDNIPLLVFSVCMILLGMIGNSTAIAFYGFSEKKIVTNILISFLAVSDLIACIVFCDEMIVLFYTFTFTNATLCKAIFVANNWVVITSLTLMTVIAIDRYRRICHPFSWQLTIRVAKIIVGCVVLFALFLNLRHAFLADIVTKYIKTNDNSTIQGFVCTYTDDKSLTVVIKASNIINMIIYFTLFLIIIIAYSLIIKKIITTRNKLCRFQCDAINKLSDISPSRGNCNEAYESPERNNMDSHTMVETDDSSVNRCSTSETTQIANVTAVTSQSENVERNEHAHESGYLDSKRHSSNVSVNNAIHVQASSKSTEIEKGITRMVAVMTLVSILSFMPYFTVVLFVPRHTSTENDLSSMSKKIARQLYMLNSIVNPYIICYFNSKFRMFVKGIICKCFQK